MTQKKKTRHFIIIMVRIERKTMLNVDWMEWVLYRHEYRWNKNNGKPQICMRTKPEHKTRNGNENKTGTKKNEKRKWVQRNNKKQQPSAVDLQSRIQRADCKCVVVEPYKSYKTKAAAVKCVFCTAYSQCRCLAGSIWMGRMHYAIRFKIVPQRHTRAMCICKVACVRVWVCVYKL